MRLYLENHLEQHKITDTDFFRSAYIWRFGKIENVYGDVLQYRVHGVIPSYVAEYVSYIQSSL